MSLKKVEILDLDNPHVIIDIDVLKKFINNNTTLKQLRIRSNVDRNNERYFHFFATLPKDIIIGYMYDDILPCLTCLPTSITTIPKTIVSI